MDSHIPIVLFLVFLSLVIVTVLNVILIGYEKFRLVATINIWVGVAAAYLVVMSWIYIKTGTLS